ncbi:MAG: hypothetical protein AAGF45_01720 [Pseudomonadota bacterium]
MKRSSIALTLGTLSAFGAAPFQHAVAHGVHGHVVDGHDHVGTLALLAVVALVLAVAVISRALRRKG